MIILIDLTLIAGCTILGFLLRFNFVWKDLHAFSLYYGLLVCVGCGLVASLVTKSYAGIVRYTGIDDGIRLLYTSFLSLLLGAMANLIFYYNQEKNLVPYSVLLIVFLASFLFLFYYRLLVKNIFSFYRAELGEKIRIAIFGAGAAGIMTKHVIDTDHKSKLKVVAFLEDDEAKIGKELNGIKIYNAKGDVEKLIKELRINELIIAIDKLSVGRKNEMVDLCLRHQVKIRAIPPARQWVRGELSLKQIKEINIEDLLEREIIRLENSYLYEEYRGKCVAITGAAGSIGSELARQILSYSPSKLLLIDQAESALCEIERELIDRCGQTQLCVYVANIGNRQRMAHILSEHHPRVIFHAAAYKHVPMMESNPSEAVLCNIMGTKVLADLAMEHDVKKFVMVSTDKSVNPTNVMGCSKRIAEIYVQSLNNFKESLGAAHTVFVTTRFGNVLGSNGSVIPVFKKQIASGGPVTVTHPEITRYFMTIPEASQLVLEAGAMGKGGEIFIFDMGNPIRIYDLAVRMIRLSGLEPNKDIEIVYTGLRQGEKLFEELLNDHENTIPTHHDKILKAKVREYPFEETSRLIELFEDLLRDKNDLKMVALMKEIVPEFKSNYSRFEILDESN